MSAQTTEEQDRDDRGSGWYIYGIVEPDVEVLDDARGIGDPPAPVDVVRIGTVAALVSEIPLDRPIGRSKDLQAHKQLLDAAAADTAVLPMRFGGVVASRDAVVDELLGPNEEQFKQALAAMAGKSQYVVRARYDEQTLVREVLSENSEAAQLADAVRDKPPESTRDARVRLGEIVYRAVERRREADTAEVVRALEPVGEATSAREPAHEMDAVHLAVLVESSRVDELNEALGQLADRWQGRMSIQLLGPMAPYDFVVTTQPPE
jgi:hypothetical protein